MPQSKNHPLLSHCRPQPGTLGLGQRAGWGLAQAPCEQVAQLGSRLPPQPGTFSGLGQKILLLPGRLI